MVEQIISEIYTRELARKHKMFHINYNKCFYIILEVYNYDSWPIPFYRRHDLYRFLNKEQEYLHYVSKGEDEEESKCQLIRRIKKEIDKIDRCNYVI